VIIGNWKLIESDSRLHRNHIYVAARLRRDQHTASLKCFDKSPRRISEESNRLPRSPSELFEYAKRSGDVSTSLDGSEFRPRSDVPKGRRYEMLTEMSTSTITPHSVPQSQAIVIQKANGPVHNRVQNLDLIEVGYPAVSQVAEKIYQYVPSAEKGIQLS